MKETQSVPLSHVARMESEEHKKACSLIDQGEHSKFGRLMADTPKHIFLILGEPRRGKTTFAWYAAVACTAELSDTDRCEEGNLFETIENDVTKFLKEENEKVLILTVGKYRKQNEEVKKLVRSFASEKVLVTVCYFERGEG